VNMRLLVLGLLEREPMHGYEIQKWLEISHTELWADVLPGSIYHALRQMEKEGLVEVQATEQHGHRARAIYALTEAGRAMFQRLLREGWQQVPHTFPSDLYTLLTFSHRLSSEERRVGLQTMLVALEKALAQWGAGEQAKKEAIAFPTFLQAVFDNAREHLEANIRLVRRLLEDPSTSREPSEGR
jgi:DNA-binding PadR family transcriptional regulator